jgi:hypothetical protein
MSLLAAQEEETARPWTAVYAEAVVLSGAGIKATAAIKSVNMVMSGSQLLLGLGRFSDATVPANQWELGLGASEDCLAE